MNASDVDWASRFQDAALEPHRWLDVLQQLADHTGSARAEIVSAGSSPAASFSWITSIDESMYRQFLDSGGHSPATNFRIAADDGRSVLKIVDESDFDRAKQGLASDDFVDFAEQNDMAHGCQTVLLREPEGLVGLSVLRTRAEGRTGEKEQRSFADAAVAASAAVRLQRAIEQQGCTMIAGAFEAMTVPCVILDSFGKVRSMTSPAEQFFGPDRCLALAGGGIVATDRQQSSRLAQAVAAILLPGGSNQERIAVGRAGRLECMVEMYRLVRREWALPFAPAAVVVLRAPGGVPDGAAETLVAAFGLTPAEAAVATLLCQGVPRAEVLRRRAVSAETLRSQLRAIYSKTGCSRESEFVLLARAALS